MTEQESLTVQSQPRLEDAPFLEEFNTVSGATLIEVLTQLACRKWLIASVTGTAILIGAVLCFVLPVRYTATTMIMPPRQTQSTAALFLNEFANSGAGPLAMLTGGGLGLKNPDDIYIGLLKSRPVADAIIRKFGLSTEYHSKDMTGARKELSDYTSIVSEKSELISISVTDTDKQRAAAMANAYTAQLRDLTKTLAVTEASQRRLFYGEQLKQAKNNLVTAEYAFEKVQQKKGFVQPAAQEKALIAGLADIHAQVVAKQVELRALRSYSTRNNPSVQLAENQLTSLQEQAARFEQRSHYSGPANLAIEDVPGASLDYLRAEREVQFQQTLYDLLLKQYEAARLDEAREGAVIQVVEPAITPDRKSSPKRALILVLFTIGGFFVACMVALIQWWRELVQSDPIAAGQLQALKSALRLRKPADA